MSARGGRGVRKKPSALADSEAARKESYDCFLTFLSGGKTRKRLNVVKADEAKKKRLEHRFKCQYCQKPFRYKCDLTRHERVHTNERPFGCDECGKKFKQRGTLNAHKLHHTGDRPFFCYICGKRFRQKSILLNHYRNHSTADKEQAAITNPNVNLIPSVPMENLNTVQTAQASSDDDSETVPDQRHGGTMSTLGEPRLRMLFAGHSCGQCTEESLSKFKRPKYSHNDSAAVAFDEEGKPTKECVQAMHDVDAYMCPLAFVRALPLLDPVEVPTLTVGVAPDGDLDSVDSCIVGAQVALRAQVNMNNMMKENVRKHTQSIISDLTARYKLTQKPKPQPAKKFRMREPSPNVMPAGMGIPSLPIPTHMPMNAHMPVPESYEFPQNQGVVPFQQAAYHTGEHNAHSAFMRVPMAPPNFVFQPQIPFVKQAAQMPGPPPPQMDHMMKGEGFGGPFGGVGGDRMMVDHSSETAPSVQAPLNSLFHGQQVPPHAPPADHETGVAPNPYPSHLPPPTAAPPNPLPRHHYPDDAMRDVVLPSAAPESLP